MFVEGICASWPCVALIGRVGYSKHATPSRSPRLDAPAAPKIRIEASAAKPYSTPTICQVRSLRLLSQAPEIKVVPFMYQTAF